MNRRLIIPWVLILTFILLHPTQSAGGSRNKGITLRIESKQLCCINYYGIKKALRKTKGIKGVLVRAKRRELVIYYDPGEIGKEGIIRRIKSVRGVGRFVDNISVIKE